MHNAEVIAHCGKKGEKFYYTRCRACEFKSMLQSVEVGAKAIAKAHNAGHVVAINYDSARCSCGWNSRNGSKPEIDAHLWEVGMNPVPVQAEKKVARTYWYQANIDQGDYDQRRKEQPYRTNYPEDANLVSSLTEDGSHAPVLDLDFPAQLVPSSTPGHYHLYLDKPMAWPQYLQLVLTLGQLGILEEGFVNIALERGSTMVRRTGVYKPNVENAPEWVRLKAESQELEAENQRLREENNRLRQQATASQSLGWS